MKKQGNSCLVVLRAKWLLSRMMTLLLLLHHDRLFVSVVDAVDDARLESMLETITTQTRDYAAHVEGLYLGRCGSQVLVECAKSNYAECQSELPMATCEESDEWSIPLCKNCGDGALYDFTASSVRLSSSSDFNSDERDSAVIDDICHSRQVEVYMREQYEATRAYWDSFGVNPPWFHYGTDSGVFRIFPGRPRDRCDDYDPRIRPWYVGASSGPKDVVLVLDTSGSMSQFGRLEAMKAAAARVIGTLGLQDYVSVVEFNTGASRLGTSKFLQRATAENKSNLIQLVNNLQAGGKTDFYRGFQLAFESLEESVVENEVSAGCQQTILFLTDGELNSDTYDVEDLFTLISTERQNFAQDGRTLPIIFSFSFGSGADESIPRSIACQTNGIWSRIEDGGDLAESMAAYYRYFAYGLGDEANEDFVSWSEPYVFATGSQLGVTASAPVYDRSVTPPLLVGAVGLDLTFSALEIALGVPVNTDAGTQEVFRRLSVRSLARCPVLNLSECNIQSLRGTEGLCPNQCSSLGAVTPDRCDTSDHPSDVWANTNANGRNKAEKSCCAPGSPIRTPGELSTAEIQNQICPDPSSFTPGSDDCTPTICGQDLSGGTSISLLLSMMVVMSVTWAIHSY